MADTWSNARPDGDAEANLVDDQIHQNNRTLQEGLDTEHDFSDGATKATGNFRHKFGHDTTTTRDGASGFVDGSIWLNTDRLTGKTVLDIYDGSAWIEQDGAFLDETQEWTKAQSGLWVTADTATAGQINWNWDDGNYFKVTLSSNRQLRNPTGTMTGSTNKSGSWVLEVTQDGTGGRTLTYGTKYLAAFGGTATPIASGAGKRSLIYCTLLPDDNILVSVAPELGTA